MEYKSTVNDSTELSKIGDYVSGIIAEYKHDEEKLELLTLDGINSIYSAQAANNTLSEINKNFFKRSLYNITGKNMAIVSDILNDLSKSQFAVMELLNQLSNDNLATLKIIRTVNNRLISLQKENDDEFECIYGIIYDIISNTKLKLEYHEQLIQKNSLDIEKLKQNQKKIQRSVVMNCTKCGTTVTGKSIICPSCGEIFSDNYPEFSSNDLSSKISDCAQKLYDCIKAENNLSKFAWDKEVQKYADVMLKTKKILTSGCFDAKIINIDDYVRIINTFLHKCSNAEFQIALIGAVKAGKSTLMNAITGCEAASTAVTPETASLTKFRASGSNENYVKVTFYNSEEWDKLWSSVRRDTPTVFVQEYEKLGAERIKNTWLNHETIIKKFDDFNEFTREIIKWTSAQAPEHYFVNEVEIGLATLDMPSEVVFVDTPGLDDPVEYRSKITQKYIKNADAVVVCVKADALRGTELKTMSDVFTYSRNNPEKVFISATQCDRLNHPARDWDELNNLWIKHLEKSQYFNSHELACRNIIPTAAGFYNLLNKLCDKSFRDNMDIDTEDEAYSVLAKYRYRDLNVVDDIDIRNSLYSCTGIGVIKSRLQREIIDKRKTILAKEIKNSYKICVESIKKAMQNEIATNNDTLENLKKSKEELLRQNELRQRELKEFKIQKEETLGELHKLIESTQKNMAELIDKIKNMTAESYAD